MIKKSRNSIAEYFPRFRAKERDVAGDKRANGFISGCVLECRNPWTRTRSGWSRGNRGSAAVHATPSVKLTRRSDDNACRS